MDDLFDFTSNNILGINSVNVAPTSLSKSKSDHTTGTGIPVTIQQQQQQLKKKNVDTYKIVIVGDAGVGKTTFLTYHENKRFNTKYKASMDAQRHSLNFTTNLDAIKFNVYDVAGQSLFAGKRDQYYKGIQGAIIMYDVMNWASYDSVSDKWLKELKEKAPSNIPICICGNKMENRDVRKVSVEVVAEAISTKYSREGIGYCEISVKTGQNLTEPFLYLTRKLLHINDPKSLYFVSNKISEDNLIEQMLKTNDNTINPVTSKSFASASASVQVDDNLSKSIDKLFLNDNKLFDTNNNNNNNNNNNDNKSSDYLDDILNITTNDNIDNIDNTNTDFIADMMNKGLNKTKLNKSKSLSPKQAIKSTKLKSPNLMKPKPKPKPKPKSKSKAIVNKNIHKNIHKNTKSNQQKRVIGGKGATIINKNRKSASGHQKIYSSNVKPQMNDTVVIDILLKIQESLNSLKSDVRNIQKDVNILKQAYRNKSQRK